MLSLGAAGGAFPDAADGRQLHHLDDDFALVDPFCSIARQDEYLLTPILDLSTYDGAFLNFKSSVLPTAGAVAEVLVSIDAGNTFSREPLFSYSAGALVAAEEDPVYGEHVLDASRVAGEGTVCFAFHYRTVGNADPPGTWWAIDDVSVTGVRGGRTLFHRGDPFNTGVINLTNGVAILNFLFLGGARPVCREAADVNNDAVVNLTDAVNVFNFLFLGGPPPADPGPISRPCGPDPDAPGSPGDLGCDTYDRC
jgi:hypothetical protein